MAPQKNTRQTAGKNPRTPGRTPGSGTGSGSGTGGRYDKNIIMIADVSMLHDNKLPEKKTAKFGYTFMNV